MMLDIFFILLSNKFAKKFSLINTNDIEVEQENDLFYLYCKVSMTRKIVYLLYSLW
jgi:hypothetical protein